MGRPSRRGSSSSRGSTGATPTPIRCWVRAPSSSRSPRRSRRTWSASATLHTTSRCPAARSSSCQDKSKLVDDKLTRRGIKPHGKPLCLLPTKKNKPTFSKKKKKKNPLLKKKKKKKKKK